MKPGVLIAGMNPVCTDAVSTAVMGYNPRATRGTPPFRNADNTLLLAEAYATGADLKRIDVRAAIEQALYRYDVLHAHAPTDPQVLPRLPADILGGVPQTDRPPPYSNWAFRGERDERWPLYSSLSRYLQNFGVDRGAWPEQEGRILRVFKRKAHQFLVQPPEPDDDFQWLALMQHHGAPTRLIDFTWSPYVAAFFALERTLTDGVVWAMNPGAIDSSRAGRPRRMDPRNKGNFSRYYLKGDHRFIWMGEPHTMNRRLIAQSGTFAVPGVLDVPIEEILSDRDQENILAKFVLTNAVREVGMRELYRMNITYATLFPDLDGLARSLGYELEFHWAYNPRTLEKFHTLGQASGLSRQNLIDNSPSRRTAAPSSSKENRSAARPRHTDPDFPPGPCSRHRARFPDESGRSTAHRP